MTTSRPAGGPDWGVTKMNESDVDELGPVDYLVVEFPADKANFSGEMASELSTLVDRGAVRVLDLLPEEERRWLCRGIRVSRLRQ